MDLFSLRFPITIVATDGWASQMRDPEKARYWTPQAVSTYRREGFIVADKRGDVWRLAEIEPEQPLRWWRRLLASIWGGSSCIVRARVEVERIAGDNLTAFRQAMMDALEKDDDVLTQFHSREKIQTIVKNADSVTELVSRLCKMKVIVTE